MAQERRSSQRGGARVIGMPRQSRLALPKYGEVDVQTLPADSATAQWLWQALGATEPNTPDAATAAQQNTLDTAAVAQPTPVQQDTVPPPPPSLQQPTATGAQAANTGTGTTSPAATPSTAKPAPTPGAAQKKAPSANLQNTLQQQLQVVSEAQKAQQIGIQSSMQPIPVPAPVGEQIESGLTRDYTAPLKHLIQQRFSIPFQQQGFNLWASVPTTRGLDSWVLLRQSLQFLKDRAPQLPKQDAQLVTTLANDERLQEALWQESRRLLEEEIVQTPAAEHYLQLVTTLKQQEAALRQELEKIPPEERVMVNQRFVALYNQYLQLQNNIMNAAALAAANRGFRINWQNLLDRAAANLLQPVWNILQRQELAVPMEQAIDVALRQLWSMAEENPDNPNLQKALQLLGQIRGYGGRELTVSESAQVAQLHRDYVTALQQAGLKPKTVYSLARVVTKPGTLPGLGWSSGPIVEPAQPIIGFLQPAQLGGAQLPNVEAPVPTSRGVGGGGGLRRTSPYILNVESVAGFGRPTIDASDLRSLSNSFAERQNIAGTTYIPYEDYGSWSRLALVASKKPGARIQIGKVVFDLAQARTDPKYWDTFVRNLGAVLTAGQSAGAYAKAVGDISAYLVDLAASSPNKDIAHALETVRQFFVKRRSKIGEFIYDSIAADVPSLWRNFLQKLSQWKDKDAQPVLQYLGNPEVREAVRTALIGGIVRYISKIHDSVTVNGQTISSSADPNLKHGIIGLLLGNLFQIVRP